MDQVSSGLVTIDLNDSRSSASSAGSRHSVALARDMSRVALSAPLLVELLNGVYFAMSVALLTPCFVPFSP